MDSAVPSPAFLEFRRLAVNDAALFAQLSSLDSPDEFERRAVELGAARGCDFTADDVRQALQAARRAWIERTIG